MEIKKATTSGTKQLRSRILLSCRCIKRPHIRRPHHAIIIRQQTKTRSPHTLCRQPIGHPLRTKRTRQRKTTPHRHESTCTSRQRVTQRNFALLHTRSRQPSGQPNQTTRRHQIQTIPRPASPSRPHGQRPHARTSTANVPLTSVHAFYIFLIFRSSGFGGG